MARLENYEKIRRTIIVHKTENEETDHDLVRKLQFLEMEKLSILRKLAKRIEIYIPDRHPCTKLLQEGRFLEVSDVTHHTTFISEKRNIQLIEHVDECNSIKNILDDETLNKLQYDEEKYYRLTTLVYHNREILRIPGVQQANLV